MIDVKIGDALTVLREMPDETIDCCVTSPPYYNLRDYGVDGQIGLEKSPHEYIDRLTEVFREVRRVLKHDGTLWLNIGDCYCGVNGFERANNGWFREGRQGATANKRPLESIKSDGIKEKDLIGIPWMLAFSMREDGWYLRSDIIWNKPNPMPESVTDRPTKCHEYIFLFSKSKKYYYDRVECVGKGG